MTVMERSHGWHQRRRGLSGAQGFDGAAQCRDSTDDHGTSRYLGSISWRGFEGEGMLASALSMGRTIDLTKSEVSSPRRPRAASPKPVCLARSALGGGWRSGT